MSRTPSEDYRGLSFWHESVPDRWRVRGDLPADEQADVAIVGAGFTGLWTAYYLLRAEPTLQVVVLEAETAGFGASGRNGGWCSALFPTSVPGLAKLAGRTGALAQHAAMRDTVDEVGRVLLREGIDAHFQKGGTVTLARSPAQLIRARLEVDEARAWQRGEDDLRLLDENAARAMLDAAGTLGASYTPHCAAVHPARLVRGLAEVVERSGGRIYENTRVLSIEPRRVRTEHGTVSADVAVRATEGYTPSLAGHRRTLVPIYSLVVATEPLDDVTWDRIGLVDRQTFADHRHLIVYGQRTADGRLVLGGRGAPYHYGSRVRPAYDVEPRVFDALRRTAVELFPVLASTRFTHAWGGALGVPRDWCASVGLDRGTGLAWAGGYVGDGVSATNLAGRTLRDLVLDRDTELTRLPWVGHRSPRWEPEPFRWLGVNAGIRAAALADLEEPRTGRPSRIATLMARALGAN